MCIATRTSHLLTVVGLLLLAGPVAGQGFRPTPTTMSYPAVYGGPLANTYYPSAYQPYNSPGATYPPSINYPAFYNPTYNGMYPTTYAAVNSPIYYNPASYGPTLTGMTNPGVQPSAYFPAATQTTFNPLAADSTYTAPLAVPLYTSAAYSTLAPVPQPVLANPYFVSSGTPQTFTNWPATYNLASSSSGGARKASRVETTGETRVKRGGNPSTAFIDLHVPATTKLWFEGVQMKQTGSVRRFVSPPLAAGRTYAYEVRATWTRGSETTTRRHRILVRAGDWLRVDWTGPGQ